MAEPKVSILLTLVDKLTAPVEGAKGKLASFGEAVTGLGAKVAALGVSAALGAFFKSAVEEATKAEASTIRLGHAVRNAGEDFGAWSPQIDDTIRRLTKLTTYTDDDLAAALGDLVTKTGDVKKSIELMGLVTDLAANRNISLEESATLVAKSLNGGGRLFKEYGITVGTAAEKTEQLAQILSGTASAAADSFGGRLSNLGKAWGELKEDAGRAIIENEAIGDALASLTVLIDELSPKVAKFVAFIVSDVVTSIQRFVEDVQKFGANAALAILGVPDRFRLAWGNLMVAISDSIADSRVLLTIFGDGLSKIADKMGDSGVRMVQESQKNLRNLKAGYDETIAGIGKSVAKGEGDKTKTTRAGTKLRLEDEQKGAKDKAAVWTGSANVFKDWERQRADAAEEADAAIRASWGLSSAYIIRETNKVVTAYRVQGAALQTIVDGLDGVYGSSVKAAPAVGKVGDEVYNAARGAISLGKEMGAISEASAAALGNVVNLADSLKDGLKGISAGNLVGAIGSLAGLLGGIFGEGPQTAARRALFEKNNQRLQELKDRMGELLNISTPLGKVAGFQGLNSELLIAQNLDRSSVTQLGKNVSVGSLSRSLAAQGLSVTDLRQLAGEFGIDLGEKNGNIDAGALRQLFTAMSGATVSGFGGGVAGDLSRLDFLNNANGGGSLGTLQGLAAILGRSGVSGAFGSIFSGVNLSDGVSGGEATDLLGRTRTVASGFADGSLGPTAFAGLSNAQVLSLIPQILQLLQDIAGATSATADGVAGGALATTVGVQTADSYAMTGFNSGRV